MQIGMLLALLAGIGSPGGAVDRRAPSRGGKSLPRFVDVDDGRSGPWLGPPKWSRRLKLRRRRARAAR